MTPPAIDPEEFLASLKEEHRTLRWEPLPPPDPNRPFGVEQVRNRASLEYLHHHWQLPNSYGPEDAGGGLRGRVATIFGRLTFRVLRRYLKEERDLLSHVVRISEALERRCDQLTLLLQQMNAEQIDRQIAEARNQAELAAWLHAESPAVRPDPPTATGRIATALAEDARPSR